MYRTLARAADFLAAQGVRHIVLSPGSRSAPLALTFMRHRNFQCHVVVDERSAGFIALGMAQQTAQPVVLICTSGTAALNYAPAIAEAFYAHIPLIVLTADRPEEWIGQADNQAIQQRNMYGSHVQASYQLPDDYTHPDKQWMALRAFKDAYQQAYIAQKGPVHINCPFREPFYPTESTMISIKAEEENPDFAFRQELYERVKSHHMKMNTTYLLEEENVRERRIMVVLGGQALRSSLSVRIIDELAQCGNVVILRDVCSNISIGNKTVMCFDTILENTPPEQLEELVPDLIISIGGPVVSKTLKQFLRKQHHIEHWHVTALYQAPDTFQKLRRHIIAPALTFLSDLSEVLSREQSGSRYSLRWHRLKKLHTAQVDSFFSSPDMLYSETFAVHTFIKFLPKTSELHLGNSLPVRQVSAFPEGSEMLRMFSNRGTSGIDGTLSTALGHALASPQKMHYVILGDLSFMYDRNALWSLKKSSEPGFKSNLRILIINNHGGRIFSELEGAARQPELEAYFVTHQPDTFEATAAQHQCEYLSCVDGDGYFARLQQFISSESERPVILELMFSPQKNFPGLKEVKQTFFAAMNAEKKEVRQDLLPL